MRPGSHSQSALCHIHDMFSRERVSLHSSAWHSSAPCVAQPESRGVSMSMMRFLVLPALFAAAIPLAQAQNVSFNATISGPVVPGVYGQLAIGNAPPPPVVYAQPVVAQPAPVVVGAAPVEPIYLHVPPGHAKNWHKYCHQYHACDRPVY